VSITVVGRGQVAVVPDVAVVELAAEGVGEDPASALASASGGIEAARQALLAGGVAEADLRSADLSLWNDTDPQGQPRGFRASVGLSATLRDVAGAGALVGDAVRAGGGTSRLRGLSLRATGTDAARGQARELAWADARRTAEQLAGLAGQALGPATEIVDGEVSGGGPTPVGRPFALAKDSGPQLEAGQLDVLAAVTVTWDLA
jgi:uncharacterized protein